MDGRPTRLLISLPAATPDTKLHLTITVADMNLGTWYLADLPISRTRPRSFMADIGPCTPPLPPTSNYFSASSMSEDITKRPLDSTEAAEDAETFSWKLDEENHLVRKLDIRIFPVIIVLFILNFVDRNNFANARLKVPISLLP